MRPLSGSKRPERGVIAPGKRFLFRTGPTFYLTFRGNRVDDALEPFGMNERDRPACGCIAAEIACIVLCKPMLQR